MSFAAEIKPLFREEDRKSMDFAFDLWSYDDVKAHADLILERDGVSYSGQVERALKLYAESKGVRSTGASHARRGVL